MDDPDCPDISFFMLTFRTGVGMIIGLRFGPDHKNHNTGKNTAGNSAPGKDTDSMFLMIGISQGRKDLSHDQLVICSQCGRYGHYRVDRKSVV